MGVFTFVCNLSGGQWSARQITGDLKDSAPSTYDLQRKLVNAALSCDSSGSVQSSFSYVSPSSAVFQVIIGGGGGGASVGGGGGSARAASGGGAGQAAEAPVVEEKKEEKEESDDDMGFSLFD